jgi:2-polyprenyl-3-methyl-5-hydroxy-6-metoxy-1,4-benzoquinol methylase
VIHAAERISAAYVEQQRALHARPNGYGSKGDAWAEHVEAMIDRFRATSVLDYGCGQGSLVRALRGVVSPAVRLSEYDPAIYGKNGTPTFADLVVCTDVLEHVEPDKLDRVLAHLKLLARTAVFAVIALRTSNKTLTDGRNAHLIVESAEWWTERLQAAGFTVAAGPKKKVALGKVARELSVILTHAEAR